MDLDIGQVRAFVAAAEELHFGRAAQRLFLTPQALSKRIRRLETFLAAPLFARDTRTVELTEEGRGFLPKARALLDFADEAATAVSPDMRPLNVDAWSHEQFPWLISEQLGARMPELGIELTTRRSLPRAIVALQRGEIDVTFGRTHDLGHPWPGALARRPVFLQPFEAVLAEDHPLAGAAVLRPADLRPYGIWWATADPPEAAGFARRFGRHFEVPVEYGGTNAGLESFVEQVLGTPGRISLITGGLPIPPDIGLRAIPIDPVPLTPWSLVWRTGDRHPALHKLLRTLIEMSRDRGWLAYDPERQWMTDVDLADLPADRGEAGA